MDFEVMIERWLREIELWMMC